MSKPVYTVVLTLTGQLEVVKIADYNFNYCKGTSMNKAIKLKEKLEGLGE